MGDIPCIERPFIQSEYNKWVECVDYVNYNKLKNTNYERTINRKKSKSL